MVLDNEHTVGNVSPLKQWLHEFAGDDVLQSLESEWRQFAEQSPRVTFFGAYDTGKSSIIRRLLVDGGEDVPEWLTISARHETFEARRIEIGGVVLQDTPGIAPSGRDARSLTNTQRAMEAIFPTDVLVVVVSPQLLTGEREAVLPLLNLPWPAGSLWFVISRFDGAGIDPEDDLGGYRELGERKVQELREQLARFLDPAPDVRVFTLAADPFGAVGEELAPEPEYWDEFRDWDGMSEFAAAIDGVRDRSSALRQAAEVRFWHHHVQDELSQLETAAEPANQEVELTGQERRRISAISGEVDELERSAQNSLDFQIENVFSYISATPFATTGSFRERLGQALDLWEETLVADLSSIWEKLEDFQTRERERPSWRNIGQYDDYLNRPPSGSQDGARESFGRKSRSKVAKLGAEFVQSVKNLDKRLSTNLKGNPTGKPTKLGKLTEGLDTAGEFAGVVSQAMDLAEMLRDSRRQEQQEAALRAEWDTRIATIKDRVLADASGHAAPYVQELRAHLQELDEAARQAQQKAEDLVHFVERARAEAPLR